MQDIDHPAERIRPIVAGILGLSPDEIDDDQDFIDVYRADSLNLIEIVAQLEKHYQVELPVAALQRARSVNALRDLLVKVLDTDTPRLPDSAG